MRRLIRHPAVVDATIDTGTLEESRLRDALGQLAHRQRAGILLVHPQLQPLVRTDDHLDQIGRAHV